MLFLGTVGYPVCHWADSQDGISHGTHQVPAEEYLGYLGCYVASQKAHIGNWSPRPPSTTARAVLTAHMWSVTYKHTNPGSFICELNLVPADPVIFIYCNQNTLHVKDRCSLAFSYLLGIFRFSLLMKFLVAPFMSCPLSFGSHAPSVTSVSSLLHPPQLLCTPLYI